MRRRLGKSSRCHARDEESYWRPIGLNSMADRHRFSPCRLGRSFDQSDKALVVACAWQRQIGVSSAREILRLSQRREDTQVLYASERRILCYFQVPQSNQRSHSHGHLGFLSPKHRFHDRGCFRSTKDRAQLSCEPKTDTPSDEANRAKIWGETERDGQVHAVIPGPVGAFLQAFFCHRSQPPIVERHELGKEIPCGSIIG